MSNRSASSGSSAVEVEDLRITYGDRVAVDGLSFSAPTGAVTVVLGPNGAGKTSTVEHLEGFRRRSGGEARVLGLDPQQHHRRLVRRVGVMLQEGGLPTGIRPRELLRQYAGFFDDPLDPDELLDQVGLTDRRSTAVRRLSGGERQRLSFALALVGRPDLAVLDEPTAGVDLVGRDVVRSMVRRLCDEGVSVLMTTHDLDEAERVADHVVIIDRGRAVAEGSPAVLTSAGDSDHLLFGAPPGIDLADLGAEVGATVVEVSPGEYRVDLPPSPANVAAVTAWLARRDLPLADLRAGRQRLDDVVRRLTGGDPDGPDRPRGRRGQDGTGGQDGHDDRAGGGDE